MRKIFYAVVLAPIGIVLIVLSVANRQPVTLSLDPFNRADPAVAVIWPFFVFLFVALLVGLLLGAIVTWFGQYGHRAGEKRYQQEAGKWRDEAERQRKRADELAVKIAAGHESRTGGSNLPAPGSRAA